MTHYDKASRKASLLIRQSRTPKTIKDVRLRLLSLQNKQTDIENRMRALRDEQSMVQYELLQLMNLGRKLK